MRTLLALSLAITVTVLHTATATATATSSSSSSSSTSQPPTYGIASNKNGTIVIYDFTTNTTTTVAELAVCPQRICDGVRSLASDPEYGMLYLLVGSEHAKVQHLLSYNVTARELIANASFTTQEAYVHEIHCASTFSDTTSVLMAFHNREETALNITAYVPTTGDTMVLINNADEFNIAFNFGWVYRPAFSDVVVNGQWRPNSGSTGDSGFGFLILGVNDTESNYTKQFAKWDAVPLQITYDEGGNTVFSVVQQLNACSFTLSTISVTGANLTRFCELPCPGYDAGVTSLAYMSSSDAVVVAMNAKNKKDNYFVYSMGAAKLVFSGHMDGQIDVVGVEAWM